jgi:Flp pilus assembly protein TadB
VATRSRDPTPRRGDVALGAGLLASSALLVALPPLAPLPLVGGLLAGRIAECRATAAAQRSAVDALPDVVDLIALGVGSGLATGPALALVGPHVPPPLGPALVAVDARLRHGAGTAAAFDPLVVVTPAARPLAALLTAAQVDGAPVVDALARLADELRSDRRRAVETRARQVPVRMLFPLVLCTLPAFVLLTIVPPIVAALRDLRA